MGIKGDVPVLVIEILAIGNALKQAIHENYSKVIIESDSLIAIQAISGKLIPPTYICT